MIQLAQYKYKKVVNAYANLDNLSSTQCGQLLAEIDWLLKNGKKFATNPVAFAKKLNSMKNKIESKLDMQHEDGVTV